MKTPFKSVIITFAVLMGMGVGAAWAQSTAATAAGAYTLKHRSTFTNPGAHNPFWPIGWVKGVETTTTQVVQEPVAPISASNFVVTGISLAPPTPMAMINGKGYAEGETIEARYGAQILKIKVMLITDGNVVLQYQNKNYTVPLKHPKLSSESVPRQEIAPPQHPMILR